MFGLSTREILIRSIKNACQNELDGYRQAIMRFAEITDGLSEEEIEDHANSARIDYSNAVFDATWASIRIGSPLLGERIRLALYSPAITGLPEEMDVKHMAENGISPGATFAICYFAVTNKKVKIPNDYKTMSMLNHYQNDLMNHVIREFLD